jgi:hypothetical protein
MPAADDLTMLVLRRVGSFSFNFGRLEKNTNKIMLLIIVLVALLTSSCDISHIENAPPRRSKNQVLVQQ